MVDVPDEKDKTLESLEQPDKIILGDSTMRVFISYRNVYPSDVEAQRLVDRLIDEAGFSEQNVFFDQIRLKAGDIWQQEIFNNIRKSDVLIVLLQAEHGDNKSTAKSEWVQREVDVARGAHVSILPIKLLGENDLIITSQVTEYLAIRDRQFLTYGSFDARLEHLYREAVLSKSAEENTYQKLTDEQKKLAKKHFESLSENDQAKLKQEDRKKFKELVELIDALTQRTRTDQRKWLSEMKQLRRKEHAENKQKAYTFLISEEQTLYLATGDLAEFKDEKIDVIVNSENDYMQLARMFEINSLSVTLRIKGAYFKHGRLMDDRVQNELIEQVCLDYNPQGLPIMLGEVIVTHAGHKESELVAKKGFRYIFHAATIHFDAIFSDEPLTPVNSQLGISTVVKNCLDKVEQVNQSKGKIFPDESRYAKEQEKASKSYKEIESIIFPLFATGQAGRPVEKVIGPMLKGIKEWFAHHHETSLKQVYISVFAEDHVEVVKSEMHRYFEPVSTKNTK